MSNISGLLQITIIIMKKCEIVRELQKRDRETSEQMLEKWHQQTCSMQDCHKLPNAVSVK